MWRLVRSAYWFVRDLFRSRAHLAAENQFLRQQLCRPATAGGPGSTDRFQSGLLAFFARLFPWRDGEVLHLVTPETLIRWHRLGSAPLLDLLKSRRKKRHRGGRPGIPEQVRELIRDMVRRNSQGRSWGIERILGELEKLENLPVQEVGAEDPPGSRAAHAGRAARQRWSTFPRNHLACTSGLSTSSRCQRSSSASSTSSSCSSSTRAR